MKNHPGPVPGLRVLACSGANDQGGLRYACGGAWAVESSMENARPGTLRLTDRCRPCAHCAGVARARICDTHLPG